MSYPAAVPREGRSICQFGLSRSGLYAVAEWYIESSGRRFDHFPGGWLDDIPTSSSENNRFVTLEALRLEYLQEGLRQAKVAGADAWIQLRDPYNWLASLQLGVLRQTVNWPQPVSLAKWKDYARLCAEGQEWISFNLWFRDAAYRRTLAERFGFSRNRDGEAWQRVPVRGGGSSFDGLQYSSRGQEMAVLERYKQFLDDPEWRAQFDDEAVSLAEKLFEMKRMW